MPKLRYEGPVMVALQVFCLALASLGFCVLPLHAANPVESLPAEQTHAPQPLKLPPIPVKFNHPGLLNDLEELQSIKKKIESGREPWKSAFAAMKAAKWADLKYKPHPLAVIATADRGAGGANDESDDAIAAYTQALMWIFTGDEKHAEKAVEILNAWTILRKHDGGSWYIMAQCGGSLFPRGAELLKATYPKWSKQEIATFSEMLNQAFLPVLHNRLASGSREFGVINALMAIGVFNDDRGAFYEGLSHWVSDVPSWIYLKEDGPTPITPDYWLTSPSNEELAKIDAYLFPNPAEAWFSVPVDNLGDDRKALEQYDAYQTWNKAPAEAFIDGLCAETFRALGNCDIGFAQLIDSAEIAWHQGIDLYSIHAKRITAFMELYALLRVGETVPKVFYRVQTGGTTATFEIAYNHFHNRMGLNLPNTQRFIQQAIRPCLQKPPFTSSGWSYVRPDIGIRATIVLYPAYQAAAWETLTHAELGGTKTPAGNSN